MKNTFNFLLLTSFVVFISSCGHNLAKEKTNAHQQIPGTNVFIVPPQDFVPTETYNGFQHENVFVSFSLKMLDKSMEEFWKPYSKEGRKLKRMSLEEKKDVRYNSHKALFFIVKNYREKKYETFLAIELEKQVLVLKSNNLMFNSDTWSLKLL